MNPSSTLKTIMFWLFIIMLGVLLWTLVSKSGQSTREKEPSYSEFMAEVDRGNVKEVTMYLSPTSYEVEGEKREPAEKFPRSSASRSLRNPLPTWPRLCATNRS